jgi:hypothetical protein
MMRSLSRPASPARRITSQSSPDVPMSAVAVMPKESSSRCASASARSRNSGEGAGICLATSSSAASTKMPLGWPLTCSIRPPVGDCVAALIPAARIAALFAQPAWPSTRPSQTGRSATAASRSAAVGKRPSFHFSWFHPRPTIQGRFGLAAA